MGTVTAYEQAAEYLQSCGLNVDIVGSDQTIHARGLHLTVTLPCPHCDNGLIESSPEATRERGVNLCASCPACHGTGKRTLRGEEKTLASLPKWLWPCLNCGGGGKTMQPCTCSPQDGFEGCSECDGGWTLDTCPACKGSGRRGPKRPPAEWWWDVLEGVRCLECGGEGGWVAPCESCSNTGYTSHPHDFLMLKRIAKPGEAAYDWLVLVIDKHPDAPLEPAQIISCGGKADNIHVYPADKWARAR